MLDGSPEVLRDVAIATYFGTQSARTHFLAFYGYNFCCMIASDMLLVLGVGF